MGHEPFHPLQHSQPLTGMWHTEGNFEPVEIAAADQPGVGNALLAGHLPERVEEGRRLADDRLHPDLLDLPEIIFLLVLHRPVVPPAVGSGADGSDELRGGDFRAEQQRVGEQPPVEFAAVSRVERHAFLLGDLYQVDLVEYGGVELDHLAVGDAAEVEIVEDLRLFLEHHLLGRLFADAVE